MFVYLFDNDTNNFIPSDPIVRSVTVTQPNRPYPPQFSCEGFIVIARDLLDHFQTVFDDLNPPESILRNHMAGGLS